MPTIDLNADVGESRGDDEALMPSISSANVACGFHAGDPTVIRQTLRLAARHGVAVGAHPGFQDREGFGRRATAIAADEVEDLVLYQVSALHGMARAEGLRLAHVKPHGALYNMAARDSGLARAIARAVARLDRSIVLVGLGGSAFAGAAGAEGLRFAAEAFADRAYEPDGSLRSRDEYDALITDSRLVLARVMRMVTERTVVAIDGSDLPIEADTICIHGDTPGAADLARALRRTLTERGITVAAPTPATPPS
jgi:UPF0271 protein